MVRSRCVAQEDGAQVTDAAFGRAIRRLLAQHGAIAIQMPVEDAEIPAERNVLVTVAPTQVINGKAFYAEHEDDAVADALRASRGAV